VDRPLTSQAVILAGGQGTRLRPLTYTRPKPVVPLLNQPFLAYQLALLRDHGVTDVILACSYRVDDIKEALGDGAKLGTRLRYVIETEPLGTGGGVRNAADLATGTVFVLNGDVLADADLSEMRRRHEARGARASIYVTQVADPRAYGLIETDADERILRFREKPAADEAITTNRINAGVYLLDAALLSRIGADRPVSIEREFFPALIAERVPLFAWESRGYWRDIGSPAAYLAAQIDLLDGRVATSLTPEGALINRSRIATTASIAAGATIRPPSVIGAGTTVAAGAVVGPHAVLGEGVRVAEGARIERSVLWDACEIGPDATLESCLIGSASKIGARASLRPGTILESGAVVPTDGSRP
jgi:mannose-1-phosphate guanylyltransferase